MLAFSIVMLVAAAALAFVAWPLRTGAPDPNTAGPDPRLIEERDRALLAKDRKLDEIRELRADRQSGKLAAADAAPLERRLRAEAADLLHALDHAEAALAEATRASRDTPPAPADPAPTAPTESAQATPPTGGVSARAPEPLP